MKAFSISQVTNAYRKRGYELYYLSQKMNIFGIRSVDNTPNVFNDKIGFITSMGNESVLKVYNATTDPGTFYLKKPLNVRGTAILPEGQYVNTFALDLHRGKYLALCQRLKTISVYRDNNKDEMVDFFAEATDLGWHGINIHKAHWLKILFNIDKYSAGCQVIADPKEFDEFIQYCKIHSSKWGNKFTYTLLNEKDLED